MRPIWILSLLLVALLAGCGGQEASNETAAETVEQVSWTGGSEVSVKASTSLADLTSAPASYVGQTVRLEGKIVGVCQGTGCWVQLEDAKGNRFYAKSVDHSIAFPKDCTGKVAVVQGEIVAQQAGGHAEEDHDQGESGHECPAPIYMLSLEGAKLLI